MKSEYLTWEVPYNYGLKMPVRAQKYLESVSWSMIMIVISNLVISIEEREPSGLLLGSL